MTISKISTSTSKNFNTDYIKNSKDLINKKEITIDNFQKLNDSSESEKPVGNIKEVVESLNRFMEPQNTYIKFELHEDLKEYYVTIVNNNTNEVLREIPSKKLLDIYSTMTEFLGLLVDKKI
ncbi:flagellar protein FlaG [Fredinandcohnia humi]